jgi:predicted nucleic acid-binding protein
LPLFLADSSIWGWARSGRRPDLEEKLALRVERGELAICVPVALEVMHRARTGEEFDVGLRTLLEPLEWLPLDDGMAWRAFEVQRLLAHVSHGSHLRPAIDFLVAAVAEAAGPDVVLWALDRDLRVICDHTRQPFEGEG